MKFLIILFFVSMTQVQASSTYFHKKSLPIKTSVFSHDLLEKVYQKYVKNGHVNYSSLSKDSKDLDEYIKLLAFVDLSPMSRNEKLAFYINAYNAYTLQVIVQNYPLKVTNRNAPKKSILQIPRVWDEYKTVVADETLSLNQIEHQKIRKFQDPRVHFLMVCAAKSCPKLPSVAFTKENIEENLEKSTKEFLNDSSKVHYCENCDEIKLSKIFEWFPHDFKKFYLPSMKRYHKLSGVITFIYQRMPKKLQKQFLKKKPKITYFEYDWTLNE
ncbi:DUF547 domain-containing protein [bacterium]|nr:DUF547 domain-containing protein [bacterium]